MTDVSYLNDDMLKNRDPITAKQLKNCTIDVLSKKAKFSFTEMFSIELKFASDSIKGCFCQKFKRRFLELDTFSQHKYEKVNLISWNSDKSFICNFRLALLLINAVNFKKLIYNDFIVRKEYMFLKTILDENIFKKSKNFSTLDSY